MEHEGIIEHEGTVVSVAAGRVFVDAEVGGACGSCAARQKCAMGGTAQHRTIEVETSDAASYRVGERVMVAMRSGMGLTAAAFGYVLPLVLLVATVAACACAGMPDSVSALAALASTGIYYAVLRAFRGRLSGKISFTISKSKR